VAEESLAKERMRGGLFDTERGQTIMHGAGSNLSGNRRGKQHVVLPRYQRLWCCDGEEESDDDNKAILSHSTSSMLHMNFGCVGFCVGTCGREKTAASARVLQVGCAYVVGP
jgi:hypothetical protein